jgi:hypothetical protein
MCHQLEHIPDLMLEYGPTNNYSMFSGERIMSALMRRMVSRRYPSKTAIEASKVRQKPM